MQPTVAGKTLFQNTFPSPKYLFPQRGHSLTMGEKNKTKTPLGRQHLKQVVKFL